MTQRTAARIALVATCLAYAAVFARHYPPLAGIEDEIGFVNQALVWSRGAISSEGAGFAEVDQYGDPGSRPHLMDFVRVGDRYLPSRHPGRSLVLLPFVAWGGVRAGFASGLLIHLAVALAGAMLLERSGRSPLWASLLLLHPTLAIYSRTVLADEAAGGCILLAALMATRPGARGAAGAGLACGLAALMRYHAGLALPIVAAAIAIDSSRARRWRDAMLCLAAGGLVASLIVAYNLALYGSPGDANGATRGAFGLGYIRGNAAFYATALMVLWPGMLLAPAFDRSPIRWIVRGVAGCYFAFFSCYYFHDRGGGAAQTLVKGLRLMEVALPIWIVGYAGVVDDRLAAPLRARLGSRACRLLVAGGLVAMLGATEVAFRKHQDYLRDYQHVRDAMVAEVPPRSIVVTSGGVHKPFGVPRDGVIYRWRLLDFQGYPIDHGPELDRLRETWFLALMLRPGATVPDYATALADRYRMRRVETPAGSLVLYRADPRPALPGPP